MVHKTRGELTKDLDRLDRWLKRTQLEDAKYLEDFAWLKPEINYGLVFDEFQERARAIRSSAGPSDVGHVDQRIQLMLSRDYGLYDPPEG